MKATQLHLAPIKNWLRWQLARAWAALGTMELFALASMALWLGLYLQVTQPLQAEAALLKAKIQDLRARHQADVQPGNARKVSADISKSFSDFLPSDEQREQQLGQLHQLADQHSLQLSRVDYRTEPVPVIGLQRLSLRLSLQGGYGMQRQFMHEVLATLPNLAIERITLEKTAGLPDSMNTLLDVSLYYRPAEERSSGL